MRATFPAGTVIPQSGTKIRAMQIISELEGTTRDPYAGCLIIADSRRCLASLDALLSTTLP